MVLVLACLGAAFGLSQVRAHVENVPVVDIGSSLTPTAPHETTGARNILIIGTDSARRLDDDDPVTKGRESFGQLADVIMILRVDPDEGSASLLSIPRDSRVEVAPNWSLDKINASIAAGGDDGARNLVRTIKRNFGISVDNYVEIDFKAFRDLVEVLGGVPVYFTTPVRDRESGLFVDSPGCILLDPDQALAWSRARHFQYQVDGKWKTDPTGDVGRISRQQEFIKRSLRRASDMGIRNPGTAMGIVNAATSSITMDDTLNVGTILDLLGEFRTFDPATLESVQVPSEGNKRGGIWYQEILWDDAEPILEQYWSTSPDAPPEPTDVIVDVVGRSSEMETLTRLADAFDEAGFDAEAFDSRSRSSDTTLRFGPHGRDAAVLLLSYLDGPLEVEFDDEIVGPRLVLTVGSEPLNVRGEPVPLDQIPAEWVPEVPSPSDSSSSGSSSSGSASSGSSSSGSSNGSSGSSNGDSNRSDGSSGTGDEADAGAGEGLITDDGAFGDVFTSDTTTTTVPGVVPVDPEKAAVCR